MPTDEQLVASAASGAASAFGRLVGRYAAPVLAVVERAVGDSHLARDLSQEIWIKVHRGLAGFRPGHRFRPWLFSIAFNHVRDEQRRVGRHPIRLLGDEPLEQMRAREPDPGHSHAERDAILAALDTVVEPYRSAVHLVDVVGLDYDEAAASLGCAVGTIKSRVNRGRHAFRHAYLAQESSGEARSSRGHS